MEFGCPREIGHQSYSDLGTTNDICIVRLYMDLVFFGLTSLYFLLHFVFRLSEFRVAG